MSKMSTISPVQERSSLQERIQQIILQTHTKAKTQADLKKEIREIAKTPYKLYMARFLDYQIEKVHKDINELKSKNQVLFDRGKRLKDLKEKLAYHLQALLKQLNHINLPIDKLNSSISDKQIKIQSQIRQLESLKHHYQIARNVIELNKEDIKALYPSLEQTYQEQKRRWYQRGVFFIVLSIVFVPLTPLFYFLWKKVASQDTLVINPKIPIAKQDQIRSNRQYFKRILDNPQNANNLQNPCSKTPRSKTSAVYVTKYKRERDKFFSQERQHVSEQDIEWYKNNKRDDLELRLTLGMR